MERSQKLEELFNGALEIAPEGRAAFLAEACAGDVELLREVESMLAALAQSPEFLEKPIISRVAVKMPIGERDETAAEPEGARPRHTTPLSFTYDGQTFGGRYFIEKELGRGGIGIVYLGRDKILFGQRVAVKVLLPGKASDKWLSKKFRQEAEAPTRISHPGVVKVLNQGETPDGQPFFVMEFIEGNSLRSVIKTESLGLSRVARLVQQLSLALTAAHSKGVHHRDLKPENVMIQSLSDGEEQAKLIDFGIAKIMDSQVGTSTESPVFIGSILYMAPEQLRSSPTSAASDIYALAVIAYEMLTGHCPFDAGKLTSLAAVQRLLELQESGIKPEDFHPSLAEPVRSVLLKALSYDAEARHTRARDFGEELAQALLSQAMGSTFSTKPFGDFPPSTPTTSKPEMAYVLFLDLVGFTKAPMNLQKKRLQQLQAIVQNTPQFRDAQANRQLISLPTGDGMALAFFGDLVAPVKCAIEIARSLRGEPTLELRMGIHTGPVNRLADINQNQNIHGGGINLAQRVMNCGDAGHILLSKTIADVLIELGDWAEYLHDLGEYVVRHGARVHLFNLYSREFGNSEPPEQLSGMLRGSRKSKQSTALRTVAAVAGLALIIIGAIAAWYLLWSRVPATTASDSPSVAQPSATVAATLSGDLASTPSPVHSPSPSPSRRPVIPPEVKQQIEQYLAQGRHYFEEGMYPEAINECSKVLAIDPKNREALDLKKRVVYQQGLLNQKQK